MKILGVMFMLWYLFGTVLCNEGGVKCQPF